MVNLVRYRNRKEPAMPDLSLEWQSDLQLSPTGGVELITGSLLTRQRLVRRFLTVPGDYIWHPDYGAGLPTYIGRPMDLAAMSAVVRDQALMEDTVSTVVSVSVSLVTINSYVLTLVYTELGVTGTQTLTLPVS